MRIAQVIVFIFLFFSSFCQTTSFNYNPIISKDGQYAVSLYKFDILEDRLEITMRMDILRNAKRLNIPVSNSCNISANDFTLSSILGIKVGQEIIDVSNNLGWDNVKEGQTYYYTLVFPHNNYYGNLPKGVNYVDILDSHGFWGKNIKIINYDEPQPFYLDNSWSDQQKKEEINNQLIYFINESLNHGHWISGIYEQKEYPYMKVACYSQANDYVVIFLSDSRNCSWWNYGDLKACSFKNLGNNNYEVIWRPLIKTAGTPYPTYLSFSENGLILTNNGVKYFFNKLLLERTSTGKQSVASGYKASGSGIVLSTNGIIATNYHVIEGMSTIDIVVNGNGVTKTYNSKVVAIDKVNDLALLQISDSKFNMFPPVPFTLKSNVCDVGEKCFAMGYPITDILGDELKVTEGIISSKTGFQGDVTHYQISASITHGNSGGPLFDFKGNLIGVTSGGISADIAQNANYAIKASYLKNLLDSSPVNTTLPTVSSVRSFELTKQIKAYNPFVVLVLVK